MMLQRVGILGGMGPAATVLLMQKLIAAMPAQDDADHLPLIVDQNPQVPSRLRYLIDGEGADPGPVLAAMAQRLQGAGAMALAMPCNTAHHFAPAIRAATRIPLIDMVALSVAHAAALAAPHGKIGILASPAVQRIGLFDAPLLAHGLTAVYPTDQAALLAIIRSIKGNGATDAARSALRAASAGLRTGGATVQMVACTEFSLISDALDPAAIGFDTLDVLVGGIVAFATTAGAGPENAATPQTTEGRKTPAI
jgi:aspartate racemase